MTRKLTLAAARRIAARNRSNPTWREFKAKWDGQIPTKGSPRFDEYAHDARQAVRSIGQIAQEEAK